MLETFGGKKQWSLFGPAVSLLFYCLCVCVRCAGFCAMPGPHLDSCLLVFGNCRRATRVCVGAWDRHRRVRSDHRTL